MKLGVITGSVGAALGDAEERLDLDTAYGAPSAPLALHRFAAGEMLVLPRHGSRHEFAPHEINYRANIRALKDAGAQAVVGLFTVGAVDATLPPGALVVPDQVIDYTWGREHTYAGATNNAAVQHVLFEPPFDNALRARVIAAGEGIIDGGTYGCTQGPRLETAAEIRRMANDGCTLVGMTGMPEATLAMELELPYAALCLVVNPAAGMGAIVLEDMQRVAADGAVELAGVVHRLMGG